MTATQFVGRNPKIKSTRELASIVSRLKRSGKKIVLAHGAFDLIHYGHLFYLNEAKKLGDVLIVSVVADRFVRKGLAKPLFNERIRTNSLALVESIDYVTLCTDYGPWKIMQRI